MPTALSPELEGLVGSRTRLLTMAVLANAQRPLTGYRIARIANLPREKVYPELRNGIRSGLVRKEDGGFRMADSDVRALLSKRIRLSWEVEWDEARKGFRDRTTAELATLVASLPNDPEFLRPKGWKPTPTARRAIREMERAPEKDALLRRMGFRSSRRGVGARGR